MPEQLPEMLLDLHKWDQLSPAECVEVAFQVERLLPPSFRFLNLEAYASASEQHHIAYFEWTAPVGASLTHMDVEVDPDFPYTLLSRNLETHDDLRILPQKE